MWICLRCVKYVRKFKYTLKQLSFTLNYKFKVFLNFGRAFDSVDEFSLIGIFSDEVFSLHFEDISDGFNCSGLSETFSFSTSESEPDSYRSVEFGVQYIHFPLQRYLLMTLYKKYHLFSNTSFDKKTVIEVINFCS